MSPSLETLAAALERLDLLVGLYAAPVLRERLASCEDADEQALIVGLVKAYAELVGATRAAFGYVTEEGALVIPGRIERELAGLIERERRWATMAGYARGRADEVAARMDGGCGPGPRSRREPVIVEPHLKMW